MRRVDTLLFSLVLCGCAHESRPPAMLSPSPAPPVQAEPSPASAKPSSDEATLQARFATAPAVLQLVGEASYYSDRLAGHKTASGEPYRPRALTAAHRTLPLGTVLRVTRRDGRRTVYVRINDRGPYGSRRRILDLSRAAFEQLGQLRAGVLEVRADVVAYGPKRGR